MSAAGLHDALRAALLLPTGHELSEPELLRAGHQLPDQLLLRAGHQLPLQLLLRPVYVQLSAGRLPGDELPAAVAVQRRAELRAALQPGAGDDLPADVVLRAGDHLRGALPAALHADVGPG